MSAYLVSDGRNRAVRTFLQGLAIDVTTALAFLLLPIVMDATSWGDLQWTVLGFLVVKTVAQSVLAYVMRVKWNRPGGKIDPPSLYARARGGLVVRRRYEGGRVSLVLLGSVALALALVVVFAYTASAVQCGITSCDPPPVDCPPRTGCWKPPPGS